MELELKTRGLYSKLLFEEQLANQRVIEEELMNGRPGNKLYMTLGFISALLGGILGIIAGYIYYYSKQKDFAGSEYYTYNENTHKLGFTMMAVGALMFLPTLFLTID